MWSKALLAVSVGLQYRLAATSIATAQQLQRTSLSLANRYNNISSQRSLSVDSSTRKATFGVSVVGSAGPLMPSDGQPQQPHVVLTVGSSAGQLKQRALVVGDVHGCLDELKQLLRQINYDASTTSLIFVGDLVNKGPYSLEVIQFVRHLGRCFFLLQAVPSNC